MVWQLLHATSLSACLPEVQKARLRLLLWQLRQTAAASPAGLPLPNGLAGLALTGSLRCSEASPWQAWHMLPFESFLAPWAVRSIACHLSSWQFAQTGWVCPCMTGSWDWACARVDATRKAATNAVE